MRKLAEVEYAKALMLEAEHWSVMKWLTEKKKVRKAADKANAALDVLEAEVKASWSAVLKAAYDELAPQSKGSRRNPSDGSRDSSLKIIAKHVKDADEEAYRVHMDAENIFDEAERKLSSTLARAGTRRAIESWELHESAIHKAETAMEKLKSAK
jgi:isopropylmalate/homocitrate/citramalate synthase